MKKKNKIILIIVLTIIFIAFIVVVVQKYYPKIETGMEISSLLEEFLEEENKSMNLEITADVAGEHLELAADVCVVMEDETRYIVIEQNDYAFYIVDGILYLEDGKAYKLTEEIEDVSSEKVGFLAQIATIYEIVDVVRTEEESQIIYSVSITGEQAKALFSSVIPTADSELKEIENLEVDLIEEADKLERIEVAGSASLGETAVSVAINISDFQVLAEGAYVIPDVIQNAVATVDKDSLFSLTEDLYRLIVAFDELADREAVNGTVGLSAHCGIINFDKEFDLADLKAGLTNLTNSAEIEQMPAIIAGLCLEGDVSGTKTGNGYVYELELKEDSIQKLAQIIVPEIVNQVVDFTNGKAIVTIEDEVVRSMEIAIDGKIKILFIEVDAEIGANFVFEK